MSCPFFWPTSEMTKQEWMNQPRMPLGLPHMGVCKAVSAVDYTPGLDELKRLCNPGYPAACERFPRNWPFQAVRFAVVRDDNSGRIGVAYVLEHERSPYEHGTLDFDRERDAFDRPHHDPTVNAQALAYVRVYLKQKGTSTGSGEL